MRILFVDMVCNKAYCPAVLENEALGGSEASLVRVAEGLAKQGHEVAVYQHNRTAPAEAGSADYLPITHIEYEERPQLVVCFRHTIALPFLRQLFPDAKIILLLEDLVSNELVQTIPLIQDAKADVYGVSGFHKSHIIDVFMRYLTTFGDLSRLLVQPRGRRFTA